MFMRAVQHIAAISVVFAIVAVCSAQAKQRRTVTPEFVINPKRPYVYLRFERIGEERQRQDGEPRTRVWFRLVNNCRVPITVGTYGVPDGTPEGEVGLIYGIAALPKAAVGGGIPAIPLVNEETSSASNKDGGQIPSGTDYSSETVPPGASLLFSVPISHLSERWRIEIPYEFGVPKRRDLREPLIGSEPHMTCSTPRGTCQRACGTASARSDNNQTGRSGSICP